MKLAVTLTDQASLSKLLPYTDIFIIGLHGLTHRMNTTFDLDTALSLMNEIKSHSKEVFINLNRLYHDEDLTPLEDALKALKDTGVDGILFADLAVSEVAESVDLKETLIYAPETYLSHSLDVAFWEEENIKAVLLSKEMTLEDILSLKKHTDFPLGFVGHGYTNMFHSRRPLIENFFKHTKDLDPKALNDKRNLTIVEEIRDEHYPIYQDSYGTHIFRALPRESFSVLHELSSTLDFMIIDSILSKEEEIITAVKDYSDALKHGVNDDVLTKYKKTHDQGLLFKKTVLHKEGSDA